MPRDLLREMREKRKPVDLLAGRSISDTINMNTVHKDKEKAIAEKQKALSAVPGKVAGFYGDVITGGLKGAASTITNIASLPQQTGRAVAEKITGKPAPKEFKTVNEMSREALKPTNDVQKGAFVAEQVGEMFIPLGVEKKITSKLAEIPELSKSAPFIEKFTRALFKTATKATASGAEYGSKTLLQTGDVNKAKDAAIISAAVPVVSDIIKATGKAISTKAIPLSAQEAKYVQAYKAKTSFWDRMASITDKSPQTAGKTAFEKGLTGTETNIGIKAKRTADSLWKNMLEPKLKQSTVKVNMPSLFDDAEREIIKKNPEVARQKDLLEALQSLRDDYSKVGDVNMMDLQNFKKGWAKFVPEKAYKGKPIAGAFNDMKDTVSGVARKKIYEVLGPEAKKAYIDWGNLQGLQELGQKAMTGGKLKGGFGGFWSAIKDMALTPAMTIGGKTVYRVGQGIELIGTKGAKTVADLFPKS